MTLPQAKDFFYQTNSKGLIEMVDAVTGKVISVQKNYDPLELTGKDKNVVEYQMPDGRVVLSQKGLDLEKAGYNTANYKYNAVVADLICNKIMEGELITKICKQSGMPPYPTIIRWRQQHPEFGEMIEMARKARAEALHDEVLETISDDKLNSMNKDDVQAAKLKVDTLKWAAEKNDPTKFGKDKTGSNVPGALQIIVNTGINRDDSNGDDIDKIIFETTGYDIKNE